MKFLATINTPGYLPWDDDPPTFDTAREAWSYLADARVRAEDDIIWAGGEDGGYSSTANTLESLGNGTLSLDEVGTDGTGTVNGDTPGYDGDHDLGLAYNVTIVEPCDEGEHRIEMGGVECIRCGLTAPDPETFTINERPLTDDTVTWAPDGFPFEGGHVGIVTYHTFASPWSDHETVMRFRTVEETEAFIVGRYGKTSDELIYDTIEDGS